jgi:glycosyltransferase involved in cell wall biosynthesis
MPPDAFDVVIVDDGSTDDTAASVAGFQRQSKLQLTFIAGEHAGPGAARNRGVQHARYDILGFIEDDVIAEEHWLERAAAEFTRTHAHCVEGTTLIQQNTESVRVFDDPANFSFIPCNLFIKKEIFLKAGGYDERFFDPERNLYFREDAELGFRLIESGCTLAKASDVIVHHPEQYAAPLDALRHVRRFFFDPLLYVKHPRLFRTSLEAKKIGNLRFNRPFHYLSLFYVLFFLFILFELLNNNAWGVLLGSALLLLAHAGIRFRYERSYVPRLWDITGTLAYLALPFWYFSWLIRGCRRFNGWGCLL